VSQEKYEQRLSQMKALVEEHDELLVKLCSLFLGDDTPNVSQWRDEGTGTLSTTFARIYILSSNTMHRSALKAVR
jgi:hypothetical protein